MNQHTADTTPEGKEALLRTVAGRGVFDDVKKYVEEGAAVNGADKNGWTALMLAAFNGHTEIAAYLVQKGADIEAASQSGDPHSLQYHRRGRQRLS